LRSAAKPEPAAEPERAAELEPRSKSEREPERADADPSPPLRNYRLLVSYEGSAYHGWQFQPGLSTVQGEIERALFAITGQAVRVAGAGRTDAGVHAIGQVATFRLATRVPEERLRPALNKHLPRSIHIRAAGEAPARFAARFSATWRRYRYLLAREPSPFLRGRAWVPRSWPDAALMSAAVTVLPGEHECGAFTTQREGPYGCLVHEARWEEWDGGLAFVIRSNRFLYQMVRVILGTCVEIGRGRMAPGAMEAILASGDRRQAGPLAPAAGLYFLDVGYEPPWPGGDDPSEPERLGGPGNRVQWKGSAGTVDGSCPGCDEEAARPRGGLETDRQGRCDVSK
jgi:tRNA pseudouridine38-40 synthase